MPPIPLKFRCHRCSQLIGAALSKAGQSVRCPRCEAPLTVPNLAPNASPPNQVEQVESSPSPRSEVRETPNLPQNEPAPEILNTLDLDPGELRELAASYHPKEERRRERSRPGLNRSPNPMESVVHPWPLTEPKRPTPESESDLETTIAIETDEEQPRRPPTPPPLPDRSPPSLTTTESQVPKTAPLVSTESSSIASPRSRPTRDVVMPRSAVIVWSLFVLMSLFVALVAGILIGHFLWIDPPLEDI